MPDQLRVDLARGFLAKVEAGQDLRIRVTVRAGSSMAPEAVALRDQLVERALADHLAALPGAWYVARREQGNPVVVEFRPLDEAAAVYAARSAAADG